MQTSYLPESTCFWFSIYKEDINLVKRLINQIKSLYPSAQIICVADGLNNLEAALICAICNVQFLSPKQHLHTQRFGGAWVERMFRTFLENSDASYLLRVEPDTLLQFCFKAVPKCDVTGNVLAIDDQRSYIHGGCVLFSREAVKKIVESGLLSDSKYAENVEFGYRKYQPPYLLEGEQPSWELHGAQDVIFSDVVARLKLHTENWNEIYSRVRETCPTPEKYAAIHPVKILDYALNI